MRECFTEQTPEGNVPFPGHLIGYLFGLGQGERAAKTVGHVFSTPYTGVSALLATGLGVVWLRLLCTGIREMCVRAALTFTGYLRRRPEPTLEHTLREAFRELDAELSAVLAGRAGSGAQG